MAVKLSPKNLSSCLQMWGSTHVQVEVAVSEFQSPFASYATPCVGFALSIKRGQMKILCNVFSYTSASRCALNTELSQTGAATCNSNFSYLLLMIDTLVKPDI